MRPQKRANNEKSPQKRIKKARFWAKNAQKRVILVEATGLEPTTFWSLTRRATKLRYASKYVCRQIQQQYYYTYNKKKSKCF